MARAKALAAAAALGRPVLVEDSGLEVFAWGGYPGPMTKWVTEGPEGPAGLAKMLDPWSDRRAAAVSALALALARPGDGPEDVIVAVGRREGTLAREPRGSNGFGWDVIFVPERETRTWAEMSAEEKDADSHRSRAFAALRAALSGGTAPPPSPSAGRPARPPSRGARPSGRRS